MMREALPKLDRQANEHSKSFGTVSPKEPTIGTVLAQSVGVSHDQSADDNDGNAGRKRVTW
jgi:hypothetical protein